MGHHANRNTCQGLSSYCYGIQRHKAPFEVHRITIFDMMNAVYRDMPLIFIEAVSDTVFGMMNAVYRDKPLILIGVIFGGEACLP